MQTSHNISTCNEANCEESQSMTLARPNVDLFEAEDHYTLFVEMPGVDENSVDITVEKDVLSIEGCSQLERPEGYQLVSGDFGLRKYHRAFKLSDDINRAELDAVMKNGVLELKMPKSQAAKTQKVTVRQAE